MSAPEPPKRWFLVDNNDDGTRPSAGGTAEGITKIVYPDGAVLMGQAVGAGADNNACALRPRPAARPVPRAPLRNRRRADS